MASEEHKPEIFLSYAREDKELVDRFRQALSLLLREKGAELWHDGLIAPGDDWEEAIRSHLASADVILLMVSASFIASDFVWGVELKHALRRHEDGSVRVIPVILRPCDWRSAPFGSLQVLPSEARPVTKWESRDEAFTDIVRGIRQVLSDESEHTA